MVSHRFWFSAALLVLSSTAADGTLASVLPQENWPQVGGDTGEQHYSSLRSVDAYNVGRLGLAWNFEFDTNRGQEATPVVIDGVMYVSSAWSKVFALDATTGAKRWSFDPKVPGNVGFKACCDVVNRGVAVSQGRVFVGTLDGRLIALDAKSGAVLWTVVTVDAGKSYSITGAPRVFKDKVIIGNGGGEYDVRGYVTAYDMATGQQRWRFFTVPGNPNKPADGVASDAALAATARPTWFGHWYDYGGGGTVWDSIVFDEDNDRIYIGVGNGTPWNRKVRSAGKGDNLFIASIVALDADTGAYRWHYQVSPGDSWDFDATQPMILTSIKVDGAPRQVLMQASKNGFFYVIDRSTGKMLSARNFVPQNWNDGFDATGRPKLRAGLFYEKPRLLLPGGAGGHSWHAMSFDPETGLVYIPAQLLPMDYGNDDKFKYRPHAWNTAIDMSVFLPSDDPAKRKAMGAMVAGELIAWDPVQQKEIWRASHEHFWNGGVLSTAGNLVFEGGGNGQFQAYRADDGKPLWSFKAPSGVLAAPITYSVGGRQFVAVLSGWGGLVANSAAGPQRVAPPGRVLAFALDGQAALPTDAVQPLAPANPSSETFTAAQVDHGKTIYGGTCGMCHGWGVVGGDTIPDLRRVSAVTDRGLWHSVVIDGVLQNAGMVSFKPYLSSDDAEAIRAYVSQQAQVLQATEKGAAGIGTAGIGAAGTRAASARIISPGASH